MSVIVEVGRREVQVVVIGVQDMSGARLTVTSDVVTVTVRWLLADVGSRCAHDVAEGRAARLDDRFPVDGQREECVGVLSDEVRVDQ